MKSAWVYWHSKKNKMYSHETYFLPWQVKICLNLIFIKKNCSLRIFMLINKRNAPNCRVILFLSIWYYLLMCGFTFLFDVFKSIIARFLKFSLKWCYIFVRFVPTIPLFPYSTYLSSFNLQICFLTFLSINLR